MTRAVCYPLMYAGVSAAWPKQEHHVGSTQWPERAKGPYAATVTCSLLSLAVIIFACRLSGNLLITC